MDICSLYKTDPAPPSGRTAQELPAIFLDKTEIKQRLILDATSLGKQEIAIKIPAGASKVKISLNKIQLFLQQQSRPDKKCAVYLLKAEELMKEIPPGFRGKLTLEAKSGRRKFKKSVEVFRSLSGIGKAPGREQKSIAPFYERAGRDMAAGNPLVITTNVVLWDQSFGSGYGSSWADGNNPKTNLYWMGSRYGAYHAFKNVFRWDLVYEESGRVAVFKRIFPLNNFWRKKGVSGPIELYAVFNVYRSDEILKGYSDFARMIFGERPKRIVLKGGRTIEAGSKSQIIGYMGHMMREGAEIISRVRRLAPRKSRDPKGVYMSSCLSANVFSHSVLAPETYGLLFTSGTLFPGAYIQKALFEAVVKGEDGNSLIKTVAQGVNAVRGKYAPGLFVSSASHKIEDFSLPYEGDSDGDGINNRIDPEPGKKNKFEMRSNTLVVSTSSGKKIRIKLDSPFYFDRYFVSHPFIYSGTNR